MGLVMGLTDHHGIIMVLVMVADGSSWYHHGIGDGG